jgi:DNA-binding FadR family transcriptional regulator
MADWQPAPGALRSGSAAEIIGRKIVAGLLTPGTVLPNLDRLAEEFSISRLSMREAIRVLADKGLVSSKPRVGTVVRPPGEWSRLDVDVLGWQMGTALNAAFIRSLFELRRMIEPEAAVLAAARGAPNDIATIERAFADMAAAEARAPESIKADVAFHQAILRATGNEFIAALAPTIGKALMLAITIQRDAWPDAENFVPSHRAILDAIQRGDLEAARRTVNSLLVRAEVDALDGLRLRQADVNDNRIPGADGDARTPVHAAAPERTAKRS